MENLQADALDQFPAPPVRVKPPGGLKIRAAQMAAFDAHAENQFIQRMTAQAQQQFPEECARLKPDVLEQRVRTQLATARRYDITASNDLCDFISVCFVLGDDFDTQPGLPWAAATLNDSTLVSGSTKMAHLRVQLSAHLERTTTPRSPR